MLRYKGLPRERKKRYIPFYVKAAQTAGGSVVLKSDEGSNSCKGVRVEEILYRVVVAPASWVTGNNLPARRSLTSKQQLTSSIGVLGRGFFEIFVFQQEWRNFDCCKGDSDDESIHWLLGVVLNHSDLLNRFNPDEDVFEFYELRAAMLSQILWKWIPRSWILRLAKAGFFQEAHWLSHWYPSMSNMRLLAPEHRADQDIVVATLSSCDSQTFDEAWEYVAASLKDNLSVLREAVRLNPHILQHASNAAKDTEWLVRLAIDSSPSALEHASHRLRDNDELLRELVRTKPHVLEGASERLRDNEELVREALRLRASDLQYASSRLRDNEELVRDAIRLRPSNLHYASSRLKDSGELVWEAVRLDPRTSKFASKRFRDMHEVLLVAVALDRQGKAIDPDNLTDNAEVMLMAVRSNPVNLRHASDRLRNSETLVHEAIELDGSVSQFVSERLRDSEQRKNDGV
jgi:hypothetical protein